MFFSTAHASSWMNSGGGVSGTVYHYDEENIYIDFLQAGASGVAGGPFCTGMLYDGDLTENSVNML